MTTVVRWFTAHWDVVALVLLVAINILNAATRHWSTHAGVVRVLLFLAEVLSIIRSRGAPEGGVLGKAKLPLTDGGARGGLPPGVRCLLLLAPLLLGCQATLGATLQRALSAGEAAGAVALTAFHAACGKAASSCAMAVPVKSCAAWVRCDEARGALLRGLEAGLSGLAAANRAAYGAGVLGAR